MSNTDTRLYELGFILVPTTPEVEVSQKVDVLKSFITKVNGTVSSESTPEYIDLAYSMDKVIGSKKSIYSQGYFGWLKFEAMPSELEALKKSLDAEIDILRYLLIKTDATNTISFKKPKIEAKRDFETSEDSDIDDEEEADDTVSDHEKLPDLASEVNEEESQESEG